ncbi:MAG: ATP-binding cassette domain-containing protein [Paenibacillaceae bacterium]|nr:ATP-binding cassette domain-containing protein [Paenibacillaceae bacterium]
MSAKAIEVRGLSKTFAVKTKTAGLAGSVKALFRPQFATKVAVQPIDFAVEQGEVLSFLGPNGAGKSTTIKMLTGILHPTAGEADVLGLCPWKQRSRLAFRVGSVFGQKSQLWYHLPPVDSFELMGKIYEIGRADFVRRRDDIVGRFEVGPYLQTPVRKLSLGERMRCEIVAALLHRPAIIFLDEPTIGLDVVVKQRIRELIREMNREEGTTLFLTSHDAGDIEQLCRRAIVINHGRIILDDKVARLKREYLTRKTIRLHLRADEAGESGQAADAELVGAGTDGVTLVYRRGAELQLAVDTAAVTMEEVLGRIVRHYAIDDVTIEDPPMEEIITQIYAAGHGKEEGAG